MVICNGGSLTSYQALAAGKPIIGLPSNLDQFLNMQALERSGAGVGIRADRFDRNHLQAAVAALLDASSRAARAAQTLQAAFVRTLSTPAFVTFLRQFE